MDALGRLLEWQYLGVVEVAWIVLLATYILLERRSPVATLAWILALGFLPGIGLFVYVVFGPRRLERKRIRRALARSVVMSGEAARAVRANRLLLSIAAGHGHRSMSLAELAVRSGEAPPARCDSVRILPSGKECYASILEAIRAARHHVHLEYYIFEEGVVAEKLRDALVERAKAGVKVRLLLDGLGSRGLPDSFLEPLEAAGGEVAWFLPIAFSRLRPRLVNFRTHRKIVICDGRVGFTGGMNVQDGHDEDASGALAWRDTQVRLEGDAVGALQLVFLEDWQFATGGVPHGDGYVHAPTGEGEHLVQIVASGPDPDAQFAIHKQYFAAIAGARERVFVSTPYFVPDEATVLALCTAARRGVDVRILVPARGDHRIVDAAARSYFPELLATGVRVFAYGPPVLHAKTLVVDRHYAAIGTANVDNRSFHLNFEVTAAVYSGEIADELATLFERDLAKAAEITGEQLEKQGLAERLFESAARLLSPIL
ncbi:MAG: cardiolipin synthase [Polyangiales bacterium]